ncbi:MAG: potassium-transporting ATPase subunit KdpB, partial [Thermoguttaceae bacterium]
MSNTLMKEPPMKGPTPDDLKLGRRHSRKAGIFDPELLKTAFRQSFIMLRPDIQWKNPVMFTVEVGAVLTVIYTIANLLGYQSAAGIGYLLALDFWLVATLLFANFASAIAEARGKAQADALRKTRRATPARRLRADGTAEQTVSTELRAGDKVEVVAGDVVPGDGEIIEGVASIDESAITGESAPVIREAGGDRSGVTGGTRLLSDRIVVEITASPGGSFLDRMIALVEGAIRQRTPNEIALAIVLATFTLIFLIVTATLWPIAYSVESYMKDFVGAKEPVLSLGTDVPTLVALLVCLIPTTIGALLAAIGIAGMDRALRANVMAKSGKAVEVAGDVDTLLLDKTGTITIGNRRATQFVPFDGFTAAEVGRLSAQASAADQTPEGKSIVELFHQSGGPIGTAAGQNVRKTNGDAPVPAGSRFVPFTAQTRMSGIDLADGQQLRKGAPDAILRHIKQQKGTAPASVESTVAQVASKGATPLLVSEGCRIAGMVVLEDILKPGITERFERL